MPTSAASFWRDTTNHLLLYLAVAACLLPFGFTYAMLHRIGWAEPWAMVLLLAGGLACSGVVWTRLERRLIISNSTQEVPTVAFPGPATKVYGYGLGVRAASAAIAAYTCLGLFAVHRENLGSLLGGQVEQNISSSACKIHVTF